MKEPVGDHRLLFHWCRRVIALLIIDAYRQRMGPRSVASLHRIVAKRWMRGREGRDRAAKRVKTTHFPASRGFGVDGFVANRGKDFSPLHHPMIRLALRPASDGTFRA
jgi:hypothetical protein